MPRVKLGIPKETAAGERRVALIPDSVKRLAQKKIEVVVESGAGEGGSYQKSRGVTRKSRVFLPGTTSRRWPGPSTGAQWAK